MDLQTLINQRVTENTHTLEVYGNEVEERIFLEATISTPILHFVTDVDCNRFKFANTLEVIDIDAFVPNLSLEFNIPSGIKQIIIRNKNILNKNLMELFPENVKYKYIECNLEGEALNIIINQLYKKYFSTSPQQNTKFMNNMIYSHAHKQIIEEIRSYETKAQQGKAFCNIIKEELIACVWHPDRVEKWINANIDLDLL